LIEDYLFPHSPTKGRKQDGERSGEDAPAPTWARILMIAVPWSLLIVLYYFYASEPDWDIAIRSPLLFFCFCMFIAAVAATIAAVFMLGRPKSSLPPPSVLIV
jgi:hypothetical protein